MAMFCGLRRDEIIGLRWAETDLGDGFVTIRATGGGEGTKSESGDRTVPLADEVIRAMKTWRRAQAAERLGWGPAWTDTGLVFTREDGTAIPGQWLSRRFETLAFRAGLPPVRFHDLRHGAASLMKAAGVDTRFISAFLGHASLSLLRQGLRERCSQMISGSRESRRGDHPGHLGGVSPVTSRRRDVRAMCGQAARVASETVEGAPQIP